MVFENDCNSKDIVGGRHRNIMMTWFYEPLTSKEAINCIKPNDKIQFVAGQVEKCPTTGRKHLQLYIEFFGKVDAKKYLYKLTGKKNHIKERIGTQEQCITYCTKERTRVKGKEPFQLGKPKAPGHRTDLDTLVDMIEDGFTSKEILLSQRGSALRYINHIKSAMKSFYRKEPIDEFIHELRAHGYKNPNEENHEKSNTGDCPEVDGNTAVHPLRASVEQVQHTSGQKKLKKSGRG